MATVDFTDWAQGDLVLTIDGKEYRSKPPTVDHAKSLLALAVQAEIHLGLVKGDMPTDLKELVDALGTAPVAEVSLGKETREQLVADGVSPETVSRMGMYGIFYWARGKERADWLADAMWRKEAEEAAEKAAASSAPKGRRSSTSGRSTASASPTPTASTRTTGSRSSSNRRRRRAQAASRKANRPAK